jgi:hypothetical protein
MEIINILSQILMVLSTILVTMVAIDKITDIYKWLGNKYVIIWGSITFVISTMSFVITDDALKSRDHKQVVQAQAKIIDNLTGGNSFPISFFMPMNDTIWDVETYDSGECALYDLTIGLIDIDLYNRHFPQSMVSAQYGGTNPVTLGAGLHTHNLCRNDFRKKDIDRNFIADYSARNLSFKQYIKCRYKNGKWLFATRIERISNPKAVVFEKAQDGFLNEKEKEIKWIDYCNVNDFKTIKNEPY